MTISKTSKKSIDDGLRLPRLTTAQFAHLLHTASHLNDLLLIWGTDIETEGDYQRLYQKYLDFGLILDHHLGLVRFTEAQHDAIFATLRLGLSTTLDRAKEVYYELPF